jgi:DNA-binding IscR family transcriptional regulator
MPDQIRLGDILRITESRFEAVSSFPIGTGSGTALNIVIGGATATFMFMLDQLTLEELAFGDANIFRTPTPRAGRCPFMALGSQSPPPCRIYS